MATKSVEARRERGADRLARHTADRRLFAGFCVRRLRLYGARLRRLCSPFERRSSAQRRLAQAERNAEDRRSNDDRRRRRRRRCRSGRQQAFAR